MKMYAVILLLLFLTACQGTAVEVDKSKAQNDSSIEANRSLLGEQKAPKSSKMKLEMTLKRKVCRAAEDVEVTLTYTNTSSVRLTLYATAMVGPLFQNETILLHDGRTTISARNFGIGDPAIETHELEPGSTWQRKFKSVWSMIGEIQGKDRLTKQKGTYQFQVFYAGRKFKKDFDSTGIFLESVSSNICKLEIE